MLVGGHLPVCSSMSPADCAQVIEWGPEDLNQHRYAIDGEALARWSLAVPGVLEPDAVDAWRRLLKTLAAESAAAGPWSRAALTERIRRTSITSGDTPQALAAITGDDLLASLDDTGWWLLLDHLQQAPGQQRERVVLDDSRNPHSVLILRRFVQMAAGVSQRSRPLIAVSTASSRDPYAAVDFYQQAFEQAGADVRWLPLDAAVRQARALGDCDGLARHQAEQLGSFDRARVAPERFAEQLEFCFNAEAGVEWLAELDGLFLNGGDQWLTLHAFRDAAGRPGPELELILRRIDAGAMVLGGTSAGAAVQSGPGMISNGGNWAALTDGAHAVPPPTPGCDRANRCPEGLRPDSLTWHPAGGLGSVAFAIVDTHFSERQRQFRLLQLLGDSGTRYGLGVDETTALLLSRRSDHQGWRLQALGAGSVWLLDRGPESATIASARTGLMLRLLPAQGAWQFDPELGLAHIAPPPSPSDALPCPPLPRDRSFQSWLDEAPLAPRCLSLPGPGQARIEARLTPLTTPPPLRYHWTIGSVLTPTAPD